MKNGGTAVAHEYTDGSFTMDKWPKGVSVCPCMSVCVRVWSPVGVCMEIILVVCWAGAGMMDGLKGWFAFPENLTVVATVDFNTLSWSNHAVWHREHQGNVWESASVRTRSTAVGNHTTRDWSVIITE
jgi:hypothetical protein